jgi:hypothetical protein
MAPPRLQGGKEGRSVADVVLVGGSLHYQAEVSRHLAALGHGTVSAASLEAPFISALAKDGAVLVIDSGDRGVDVELFKRLHRTGQFRVIVIAESISLGHLPSDAEPVVSDVLVRSRFSLAQLARSVHRAADELRHTDRPGASI